MTEANLQAAVIELARLCGYRVAHFRPAKTERGWRTPVEADGQGFPDLVLARSGRLIFAELKGSNGHTSAEQKAWLDTLRIAGHAEVYLWRPVHWTSGEIEAVLLGRLADVEVTSRCHE